MKISEPDSFALSKNNKKWKWIWRQSWNSCWMFTMMSCINNIQSHLVLHFKLTNHCLFYINIHKESQLGLQMKLSNENVSFKFEIRKRKNPNFANQTQYLFINRFYIFISTITMFSYRYFLNTYYPNNALPGILFFFPS